MVIRQEQAGDLDAVYQVHKLAFGTESESKLVNLLRQGQHFIPGLSLVAENETRQVIGHILFTTNVVVDPQQRRHPSLSLAPVSVLPAYQNKGIGSMLIRQGLEIAAQLGYSSVIVLGHAQYYPRFGFLPAETWNIFTSYDVPSSHFMALELQEGGLQHVSGIVEYPAEFESL